MTYKDFKGKKLSALGMGCMRLPQKDDEIDMTATRELVAYAMKNGINYFDTAWGYHGGKSEIAMGEILRDYPRDSFYLATKFPGYDVSTLSDVEGIFEKQLEKCGIDYFDFYLVHNVCEINIDGYLNPDYHIYEYLMEQKKNGRIRHLGFSAHGTLETMQRFLDAYGEGMEFCQLQVNWLDWEFQDAKAKMALMAKYNLPVWVMEPVRGGSLAKLADKHEQTLKALRPEYTAPEWAFRFLQGLSQVVVTLSGMSNLDQLKENIATYEENKPLDEKETAALISIAREMTSRTALPCTGCKYCVTHCPRGLDIPRIINIYNEYVYTGGGFVPTMAVKALDEDKRPSSCLGCRACEDVCPQNIRISEMMSDFSSRLK